MLLALGEGARHGYGIREAVENHTKGKVKLWPANLYGSIKDMAELSLLGALEDHEQPIDNQRRRVTTG